MARPYILRIAFAFIVSLPTAASFADDAVLLAWDELFAASLPMEVDPLRYSVSPPGADRSLTPVSSGQHFSGGQGFFGASDRSASEPHPVRIPEPLLFDLVRPLGPTRGDFEFNTLAIFPWSARTNRAGDDPFGPGPTTKDRGQIEWAPEVEIALSDRFAIEFELPFEGTRLEELKVGLQWTFGTAFNNHFIHGMQVLIEPTPQFETWSSTLLYVGGLRFDETWSTLVMFGGRMDLEGPDNIETFERLFNVSLFADVNEWLTVGLETNTAIRLDGSGNFILVPQAHIELTSCLEIQTGAGFGAADDGYEMSGIIRVIYAR